MRAVERERARVERLQADILERQRLRREATLYSDRAERREAERRQREEAERQRLEDERRAREAEAAEDDDQAAIVIPSPRQGNATRTAPAPLEKSDWDRLIDSVIRGAEEPQGISPPVQ
nr:hypothetical protein [Marinicella sp. W31]MDC2877621.1 hypothetical protein [Marinicella sp. W31]